MTDTEPIYAGWPGWDLAVAIEHGLELAAKGVEPAEIDAEGSDTIRYPSGIPRVNAACGGFYGVSVIVGGTGVGKSMAAIACAVDAAVAGLRVVYFNAEIPPRPFAARIRRRIGNDVERMDRVRDHLRHFQVGPGVTLEEMRWAIRQAIEVEHDTRLLVIVDSVNTVAEMQDGLGYFDALKGLGLWAMQSRKTTEGRVGWVLVSETNQRGDVKGGKLAFLADLVLHLERSNHPDHCKLIVQKGREGGGGDLGVFLREWRTGEFVGEGEASAAMSRWAQQAPPKSASEEEPVW